MAAQDVRKQAVVVLSDGQDTSSLVQYEDVMELANESGIVLYTILLLSPFDARQLNDLKTSKFSQALYVMRSFAEATGGVTFLTSNVRDLQGIYTKIATELAQQYTLGYMSTNARRDGKFRRIVVRVVGHPDVRHTNAHRISGAETVCARSGHHGNGVARRHRGDAVTAAETPGRIRGRRVQRPSSRRPAQSNRVMDRRLHSRRRSTSI